MNTNSIIKTLNCLVTNGIRLICIDFDNTLLSISTYGKWDGSAQDLSDYIRPVFVKFIKKCILKNIHIAIVTFSSQEQLVNDCLQFVFQNFGNKIHIRTTNQPNTSSSKYCNVIKKKIKMLKKNPLMLSVASDIFLKTNETISPKQILLIDDDWKNISTARKSGFKVYHFTNEKELRMIKDLSTSKMEHYSNSTTYTFVYADLCRVLLVIAIILFLFWNDRTTTEMGTRLVSVKL